MNWKVEFTLGYGPATCANEFQLPGRGGGIAFRHRGISISHNRLRTVCSNTKREWSLLCKVTLLFHSARAPEQGFSCFLAVCCFMSASMRAVICHRCFLTYSFSLWCRECKHLHGSFPFLPLLWNWILHPKLCRKLFPLPASHRILEDQRIRTNYKHGFLVRLYQDILL